MNQLLIYFSGISPTERVTFINTCEFTELLELKIKLEEVYSKNGMWEAYAIECKKEIFRRREGRINEILNINGNI